MYLEKRVCGQAPSDWAKNLGIDRHGTLGAAADLRFRLQKRADPLWREMRRHMRPGHRVLDAGCGMGQWVRFLRWHGIDAAGLDFSPTMVDALKREFPQIEWFQGEVQKIPCEDSAFHHVISWGVVEHDERGPDLALAEFRRIIRPGGYCFVTTPVDSRPARRSSELHFDQEQPHSVFFQYFFTPDELAERVRQAGFEVVVARTFCPSYAVAFPELYFHVSKRGRITRRLVSLLTRPFVLLNPDWHSMSLVVGRVQPSSS